MGGGGRGEKASFLNERSSLHPFGFRFPLLDDRRAYAGRTLVVRRIGALEGTVLGHVFSDVDIAKCGDNQ